jgi:hypothetical protein
MDLHPNEFVQARSRHLVDPEDLLTLPVLDPRIGVDSTQAHSQRKAATAMARVPQLRRVSGHIGAGNPCSERFRW